MSAMAGVPAGVFLIVGLLSLLFAWKLWRLARWAFWASVIIEVISLANSVITFTQPKANDGPL
jgi:FtsH-binding integral membrane protein